MPVYQGTYYARQFQLSRKSDGTPIDITGWEFASQARYNLTDPDPAPITITSLHSPAPPGIVIIDAVNGVIEWRLYEDQTESLHTGTLVFDVMRIDIASGKGPEYLFGGRFTVAEPVTRDFES
jgi:hypothetical protein